jgi:toxin ParE1/3/4
VANRLINAIAADFDRLLSFPHSGPAREHFAPGLRAAFHGSYVIYYLPTDRELIVVRVLHAARDAAALAGRGGFAID